MLDQDVVNLIHFLRWNPTYSIPRIENYFSRPIHEVFFCDRDTTPEDDASDYMDGNKLPKPLRNFILHVDEQMTTVPPTHFMFGFPVNTAEPRRPGEKRAAFIAMPYSPEWSKGVADTIVTAGHEEGFACIVSRDLRKPGSIIEQVWEDIRKAEVLIADLTLHNPNVFYELGLADALGKQCILLQQGNDQPPFDMGQQRCIAYDPADFVTLKDSLTQAFREVKPRYKFDEV